MSLSTLCYVTTCKKHRSIYRERSFRLISFFVAVRRINDKFVTRLSSAIRIVWFTELDDNNIAFICKIENDWWKPLWRSSLLISFSRFRHHLKWCDLMFLAITDDRQIKFETFVDFSDRIYFLISTTTSWRTQEKFRIEFKSFIYM